MAFKTIVRCSCVSLLASGISGCSSGGGTSTPTVPTPSATGVASVSGISLLRDGKPWEPHGFYQIAFEVPPGELPNQDSFWTVAQQNYNSAEYTQMSQFGADSVRMQVAQTGMDPQGVYYSASYSALAISAIKAARTAGLTVIVSVQDEPQTGEPSPLGLPGPATQRVWNVLTPIFKSDKGVLFELFNEPYIAGEAFTETVAPSTANWAAWKTAMDQTLASVRAQGSVNVIVADGLVHAELLTGAPALSDPLNQVVYAAHPYAHFANDQLATEWDFKFGNFAKTAPVLISEWGTGYYCDNDSGIASQNLFTYLHTRGIGMEMGAWDWSPLGFGTAIEGFPNNQLTSYPAHGTSICNANARPQTLIGPGKLIQTWYTTGIPSAVLE